jgi:hypothetical protein
MGIADCELRIADRKDKGKTGARRDARRERRVAKKQLSFRARRR